MCNYFGPCYGSQRPLAQCALCHAICVCHSTSLAAPAVLAAVSDVSYSITCLCSRRKRLSRSSGSWPRRPSRTDLSLSGSDSGQETRLGETRLRGLTIILQQSCVCPVRQLFIQYLVAIKAEWFPVSIQVQRKEKALEENKVGLVDSHFIFF